MTKKISISIPPLFSNDEVLDGGYFDLKDVVLDDEVLGGDSYSGELKDGSYHGYGTYKFIDGSTHTGEWKEGLRSGEGSYTFATGEFSGDRYVGEWRDDEYNGQGTYTRADGGKYVGEWKDNDLWNGAEYDKDGKVITTWSEGVEKEG